MIELVLITLCSWQIYRLARQRALTAWKWILNFLSGYLVFGVLLSFGLVYFYGAEVMKDLKTAQEKITPFTPYVFLFLVFWFLFIRSRILQYEELNDNESDDTNSEPPVVPKTETPDKKDLSYFR